jgi:hypothetical protein
LKQFFYIFNFAFLIFHLTSCYTPRYVYSPSAHNVPILVKKGDSKLAFNYSLNLTDNQVKDSVSTTGKARGYDLQAAYAFTHHWAVQINYFKRIERNAGDFDNNLKDSVVINYRRSMTEMGLGYFHQLNENNQAIFQFFAGVGFGAFSFTDNGRDRNSVYRSRYHNMNVTKLFIQPAFILRSRKNFAATISSRHSIVYFKNIKTDYTATELDNYKLDSLNYSPRVFWEPAIINSFGFKKLPGIKFEFQTGFSFLQSRRFVDARFFNFSAGLLFDLPKLFAVKKQSVKK